MTAGARISLPTPTEVPVSSQVSDFDLTVKMSRGTEVRMTFRSLTIDTIQVRVNGRAYLSSLRNCKLERPIHVDGMEFLRDDLRKDEDKDDAATLFFDVGSESERQFGKLPRVQLSWRNGRLIMALISRQNGNNSGFSYPLCKPDVR
jgi:hypothetical protein